MGVLMVDWITLRQTSHTVLEIDYYRAPEGKIPDVKPVGEVIHHGPLKDIPGWKGFGTGGFLFGIKLWDHSWTVEIVSDMSRKPLLAHFYSAVPMDPFEEKDKNPPVCPHCESVLSTR